MNVMGLTDFLVLFELTVEFISHFIASQTALFLLVHLVALLQVVLLALAALLLASLSAFARLILFSVSIISLHLHSLRLFSVGLSNAILDDVGPEVSLEVGQHHRRSEVVVPGLLVDVFELDHRLL